VRKRRVLDRRSILLVFFALIGSCREPTQITLVLTNDLPCTTGGTTTIGVGPSFAAISAPGASTATCPAGRPADMGTLVLVPTAPDAEVSIAVIAGVGREACSPQGPDFTGCIVAKRRLRFAKHESLVLPIALHGDCIGVACSGDQTCVSGVCASAAVECAGGACHEPDAGTTTDGAVAIDGARDGHSASDGACGPILASNPGKVDCVAAVGIDSGPPCAVDGSPCCATTVNSGSCMEADLCIDLGQYVYCDETADCPPQQVCCASIATANGPQLAALCLPSCRPGDERICKSTCECAGCAPGGACGTPTCSGNCPH
jgi:hypothetical protein